MQIKELIDIVGKNLSRVKTIGIIVLVILFTLSSIRSGCDRERTEKLAEKITGLNVVNDILTTANAELDSMLEKEIAKRKQLEAKLDTLASDKGKILAENKRLKYKLENISEGILIIPADSSYTFLNEEAYPYPGEKKYPFSEPQVKAIHVTYMENEIKDEVIDNQQVMIDNCEQRITFKDSITYSYMAESKVKSKKIENLSEIADNSEEKAIIYQKELQKQKRRNNLYKITTVAGIIGITILLL